MEGHLFMCDVMIRKHITCLNLCNMLPTGKISSVYESQCVSDRDPSVNSGTHLGGGLHTANVCVRTEKNVL